MEFQWALVMPFVVWLGMAGRSDGTAARVALGGGVAASVLRTAAAFRHTTFQDRVVPVNMVLHTRAGAYFVGMLGALWLDGRKSGGSTGGPDGAELLPTEDSAAKGARVRRKEEYPESRMFLYGLLAAMFVLSVAAIHERYERTGWEAAASMEDGRLDGVPLPAHFSLTVVLRTLYIGLYPVFFSAGAILAIYLADAYPEDVLGRVLAHPVWRPLSSCTYSAYLLCGIPLGFFYTIAFGIVPTWLFQPLFPLIAAVTLAMGFVGVRRLCCLPAGTANPSLCSMP